MSKVITSAELQQNTQKILDWTRAQGEPVIVEAPRQPSVVILRFDEYEAYLRYKEARRERFARLEAFADQTAAHSGLNEAKALALADEAREEVYRAQHGD